MNLETPTYKIRGTKVTSPYPVQLTPAETRLIFSLQRHFPPNQIFPDCFFPRPDTRQKHIEDTTLDPLTLAAPRPYVSTDVVQIDCLAVSQQGIFVFESKDYSGYIFGQGDQHRWTQTLDFGREKFSFYNPVRQNSTHLAALSSLFPVTIPIYSVIVFGRDATLRVKNLPNRCLVLTQDRVVPTLATLPPVASLPEAEIQHLLQTIHSSRLTPTPAMRQNHITEVNDLAK